MENIKYIPGDLVMADGVPLGTKIGVAYRVTASNPSRTETFESGKVLKGAATLDNVDDSDLRKEGYLYGECGAWVKDIIPIPITPEILEKNGWSKNEYEVYFKFFNSKMVVSLVERSDDSFNVIVGGTTLIYCKFIHELQHLLFGLGLDSNLKV